MIKVEKSNTYKKSFPQPRGPKNISDGRQTFLQTPLRLGQDQGKAAASFSTTAGICRRMDGYLSVCLSASFLLSIFPSFCPLFLQRVRYMANVPNIQLVHGLGFSTS